MLVICRRRTGGRVRAEGFRRSGTPQADLGRVAQKPPPPAVVGRSGRSAPITRGLNTEYLGHGECPLFLFYFFIFILTRSCARQGHFEPAAAADFTDSSCIRDAYTAWLHSLILAPTCCPSHLS